MTAVIHHEPIRITQQVDIRFEGELPEIPGFGTPLARVETAATSWTWEGELRGWKNSGRVTTHSRNVLKSGELGTRRHRLSYFIGGRFDASTPAWLRDAVEDSRPQVIITSVPVK